MLKKQQQQQRTNKQKQQSNNIAHVDLEWSRIIGVRHGPYSQFHILIFDA